MNGQTAVVIGATGLVGRHLVECLEQDAAFDKVITITRRAVKATHPKVVNKVVNFNHPETLNNSFDRADVIFSAVGTTKKKVKGNKTEYRKIDYDIQVNMAKVGVQKGVKQFILISALGADQQAGNYYLRLKGEIEEAVKALPCESVYILRPSILLGNRSEFRLGEAVGKAVMQSASVLFFGPMRKYYPAKAMQVARAMVGAGKEKKPGMHILHYDDFMKWNQ